MGEYHRLQEATSAPPPPYNPTSSSSPSSSPFAQPYEVRLSLTLPSSKKQSKTFTTTLDPTLSLFKLRQKLAYHVFTMVQSEKEEGGQGVKGVREIYTITERGLKYTTRQGRHNGVYAISVTSMRCNGSTLDAYGSLGGGEYLQKSGKNNVLRVELVLTRESTTLPPPKRSLEGVEKKTWIQKLEGRGGAAPPHYESPSADHCAPRFYDLSLQITFPSGRKFKKMSYFLSPALSSSELKERVVCDVFSLIQNEENKAMREIYSMSEGEGGWLKYTTTTNEEKYYFLYDISVVSIQYKNKDGGPTKLEDGSSLDDHQEEGGVGSRITQLEAQVRVTQEKQIEVSREESGRNKEGEVEGEEYMICGIDCRCFIQACVAGCVAGCLKGLLGGD